MLSPIIVNAMSDSEYQERLIEIASTRDSHEKHAKLKDFIRDVDPYGRFSVLPLAAKAAFEAKDFTLANLYANELIQLSAQYEDDWNFGNAIHDGNMVLGRLAAKDGKINLAVKYLHSAGSTPGSPQLNSFGPNMSLANDLLELGETESVIEYFEMCKRFWKMEDGRLDSWAASIKGGGTPYFGTHSHY